MGIMSWSCETLLENRVGNLAKQLLVSARLGAAIQLASCEKTICNNTLGL